MQTQPRVLGNRYELHSRLATGGMGQVWRAHDTLLGRPVAVKVLRSEFTDNPTFRARFQAEARHAAALIHPGIASVFDYGEVRRDDDEDPLAYLVMELVEGESLSSLLEREHRLDPRRTLDLVRQTAAALAAAHAAGVVHRDIKPGNVLVTPDGVVKITDFGIAWSAASVPLTETGQVVGTAHYLSPEQAQGGKASPASDVYALGAVAYECLAGRRLYDGESSVQVALRQIRDEPDPLPADVPVDVRALVGRALDKDPAQRFPDGAALREAAEAVLAGRPIRLPATAVLPVPLGPGAAGAVAAAGAVGAVAAGSATDPARALAADGPLRGAPAGRTAAGDEDGPGGERRRLPLRAALAVVGLLAVAAVVAGVVLGDTDTRAGGSDASPATTTAPATSGPVSSAPAAPTPTVVVPAGVPVDPAAFVGRPVAEVRDELVALGLQVDAVPSETDGTAAGLVTAVDPGGELPRGSTVAVTYAVAPVVVPEPAPAPPVPQQAPQQVPQQVGPAEERGAGAWRDDSRSARGDDGEDDEGDDD